MRNIKAIQIPENHFPDVSPKNISWVNNNIARVYIKNRGKLLSHELI